MVFSSLTFLFMFLPIVLLLYYLVPTKAKNYILLLCSLCFYSFGEPKYIFLLLISCLFNFIFGLFIEKQIGTNRKVVLCLALFFNIALIGYFKYTDFFIQNINALLHTSFSMQYIVLPIGISFYTFQCISYIIDVYHKKVVANRNLFTFATYVCLFPQLIAGPIVRYVDVYKQLLQREHTFSIFSQGIQRFIIGLSKKVLLANMMGEFIKSVDTMERTLLGTWIVAIAFVFQLYFDFSGYSDMAIGLGKMFGFTFLENFNYPLIASSITDFWRRWHISLSSWFRDYVYIPLKGSRVKPLRLCMNLLIVWLLTGLWHGAKMNFVIWGVYFALFLCLEKLLLSKYLEKYQRIRYVYTGIVLCVGFTLFQYDISLWQEIFTKMFGFFTTPISNDALIYYLRSYAILFLICGITATPLGSLIVSKIKENKYYSSLQYLEVLYCSILFIICIAFIVDASFNPFLYFRF